MWTGAEERQGIGEDDDRKDDTGKRHGEGGLRWPQHGQQQGRDYDPDRGDYCCPRDGHPLHLCKQRQWRQSKRQCRTPQCRESRNRQTQDHDDSGCGGEAVPERQTGKEIQQRECKAQRYGKQNRFLGTHETFTTSGWRPPAARQEHKEEGQEQRQRELPEGTASVEAARRHCTRQGQPRRRTLKKRCGKHSHGQTGCSRGNPQTLHLLMLLLCRRLVSGRDLIGEIEHGVDPLVVILRTIQGDEALARGVGRTPTNGPT